MSGCLWLPCHSTFLHACLYLPFHLCAHLPVPWARRAAIPRGSLGIMYEEKDMTQLTPHSRRSHKSLRKGAPVGYRLPTRQRYNFPLAEQHAYPGAQSGAFRLTLLPFLRNCRFPFFLFLFLVLLDIHLKYHSSGGVGTGPGVSRLLFMTIGLLGLLWVCFDSLCFSGCSGLGVIVMFSLLWSGGRGVITLIAMYPALC